MKLNDLEAMNVFGEVLAGLLKGGMIVYLKGDLGTGKTTLSQNMIRTLGFDGRVKSPTYTLVESYDVQAFTLHHFDLYRLNDPEELEFIGWRDYICDDSVALIEWPEKAEGILPPSTLTLSLAYADSGRDVDIIATSEAGQSLIKQLQEKGF